MRRRAGADQDVGRRRQAVQKCVHQHVDLPAAIHVMVVVDSDQEIGKPAEVVGKVTCGDRVPHLTGLQAGPQPPAHLREVEAHRCQQVLQESGGIAVGRFQPMPGAGETGFLDELDKERGLPVTGVSTDQDELAVEVAAKDVEQPRAADDGARQSGWLEVHDTEGFLRHPWSPPKPPRDASWRWPLLPARACRKTDGLRRSCRDRLHQCRSYERRALKETARRSRVGGSLDPKGAALLPHLGVRGHHAAGMP